MLSVKDLNFDVETILPEGMGKEFIFDPKISTLSALENTIASGFAKVLYPGQKITNLQINEAKSIIKLRGLSGSDEVKNRLKEVKQLMKTYTTSYQRLLEIDESNKTPRLKLNLETGEFEEF